MVARAAAIVLLSFVATAPAALGAPARPPADVPASLTQTAEQPGVQVHFTTAEGDPARVTAEQAATLAANARTALDRFAALGFGPLLDDGDGRTDIYVYRCESGGSPVAGFNRPDAVEPATAWVCIDPSGATDAGLVTHELVHTVQASVSADLPTWLAESTAQWGLSLITGDRFGRTAYDHPEVSLDCVSAVSSGCGNDRSAYGRNSFWTFLDERFGVGTTGGLLKRGTAYPGLTPEQRAYAVLDAEVAARGTTLEAFFGEFAAAVNASQFRAPGLAFPAQVTATGPTLALPVSPAGPVAASAPVDHLATGVVTVSNVMGPGQAGDLTLRVGLPTGVTVAPTVVNLAGWAGTPATPLVVSPGAATITLPWSTGSPASLRLSLPNPLRDRDQQIFTVEATFVPRSSTFPAQPAPTLTSIRLKPTSIRRASRGAAFVTGKLPKGRGGVLSWTAANPGTVKLGLQRLVPGYVSGARCVTGTRRGAKRCTRTVTLPDLPTQTVKAGRTSLKFTGRNRGKALAVGTYRLRLGVFQPNGRYVRQHTLTFRVKK